MADEEEKVPEKVEEVLAAPEQVEKVEAPAKKGGRRKAVAALEEVAAPSPVKRGRRAATVVEEEKEEEVEVKKSPVKRGRKAAVEKVVTEEETRYGLWQLMISNFVLNFFEPLDVASCDADFNLCSLILKSDSLQRSSCQFSSEEGQEG